MSPPDSAKPMSPDSAKPMSRQARTPNHIHTLEVEGEAHRRALAELKAKYPRLANEDGLDEDDARAMADTLEGMTSLGEAVDAVVEAIRDDEQWARGALPEAIRKLQARRRRLLARASANRDRLLHVLASCGVVTPRSQSYRRPAYTLTVPAAKRVPEVTDPAALPAALLVTRAVDSNAVLEDFLAGTLPPRYVRDIPPEPDMEAVAAEVDAGRDVPGVELVLRQPSIQIRT